MATARPDLGSTKISFKLWPPSERTRKLLVEKMAKNLSSVSIYSNKFGLMSEQEATKNAIWIEETSFASADEMLTDDPDDDGSAAVQQYAKESSKLVIELLKRPRNKDNEVAPPSDMPVQAEIAGSVTVESVPGSKMFFDISGGPRAFIDAEEASNLLRPLTEHGNSYQRICFSNRSFGVAAASVAGPILASLSGQLKEVDLSDFVAGRPEEEALEVMRMFSSALEGCALRCLDLSDNAMGEKGVRAFSTLLKSQGSLEELYLMNDGISEEAASAVRELIPSTEKLKVLHFHNNMTGDAGAEAITQLLKASPLLEDFRCSSSRIGSEGGTALADGLQCCPRLSKLDLRDNIFGVEVGLPLSRAIKMFDSLTECYLSYLNLEDDGIILISEALKEAASNLKVLELAGNDITVKAARSLADCIAGKCALKKLSLAENELKDEGALLIAGVLEDNHSELKELDVSSNKLWRIGARCLAKAVSSKPDFVLLNINGNAISDEGIDEVKKILKSGKNSVDVLGPLDENDADAEGEDSDEEEEGSNDGDADEDGDDENDKDDLEIKMNHLKVAQE